jgi:rfaE bifunctional protein nucleotidyltransferase chain/domain
MAGTEQYTGDILDLETAASLARVLQADGRRIVFTNGCFDLLHVGHVDLLARARMLGDCLFVGLNGDESVRLLKGPGRPVVAEQDRAAVLASMRAVDVVVVFPELTAERLVAAIRPDIYVKGGDWDTGQKVAPEAAVVASYGGRVVYLPYQAGRSTTQLLAQIRDDSAQRG